MVKDKFNSSAHRQYCLCLSIINTVCIYPALFTSSSPILSVLSVTPTSLLLTLTNHEERGPALLDSGRATLQNHDSRGSWNSGQGWGLTGKPGQHPAHGSGQWMAAPHRPALLPSTQVVQPPHFLRGKLMAMKRNYC